MLSTPQSKLSVAGSDANLTRCSLVSNFAFGCAYFASLGKEVCFCLCHQGLLSFYCENASLVLRSFTWRGDNTTHNEHSQKGFFTPVK